MSVYWEMRQHFPLKEFIQTRTSVGRPCTHEERYIYSTNLRM